MVLINAPCMEEHIEPIDVTVGGGKFLEFNFANIQSFRPSKRSPEQQKSGLFYVPKKSYVNFSDFRLISKYS